MHKQVRERTTSIFSILYFFVEGKEEKKLCSNFYPRTLTTTFTKSLNYRVGGMMMGLVGWMVGCCIMNVAGE
jgi:hypothetical protein